MDTQKKRLSPRETDVAELKFEDITQWVSEHKNLCHVMKTIGKSSRETFASMANLLEESVSRGEQLLSMAQKFPGQTQSVVDAKSSNASTGYNRFGRCIPLTGNKSPAVSEGNRSNNKIKPKSLPEQTSFNQGIVPSNKLQPSKSYKRKSYKNQ